MTVDERFEQLERKTQRLEKRNKHLTVALTMTVVAMAAVVTMAETASRRPLGTPGIHHRSPCNISHRYHRHRLGQANSPGSCRRHRQLINYTVL
jgi:hypothetical protein